MRLRNGGLYSWQPGRTSASRLAGSNAYHERSRLLRRRREGHSLSLIQRWIRLPVLTIWPYIFTFRPFTNVFLATATGLLISYLVPPIGLSGRAAGETAIFGTWVFSWIVSSLTSPYYSPTSSQGQAWEFHFNFIKDILSTGAIMGVVIATQVGILNGCDCYTLWGWVGLQLPGLPSVAAKLLHGLHVTYPAISFVGIAIHLVILPVLVLRCRYSEAVSVFLMRDDSDKGTRCVRTFGPWGWLYHMCCCCCLGRRKKQSREDGSAPGSAGSSQQLRDLSGNDEGEDDEHYHDADDNDHNRRHDDALGTVAGPSNQRHTSANVGKFSAGSGLRVQTTEVSPHLARAFLSRR